MNEDGFGDGDGFGERYGFWGRKWVTAITGREMGLGREMADALWEGHTLLKTVVLTDRQTDTQK